MADEADFSTSAQPSLQQLATFLADELFDVQRLRRVETAMRNAHAEGSTVASAAQFAAVTSFAVDLEAVKQQLEAITSAISAWMLSVVVENTFDVDVDNVAFAKLGATSGRRAVAKAITDKMILGLTGGSTSIEASPQPAANYLSTVFHQVFESWVIGESIEIASAFVPFVEKIEHVADLGDKVVAAMGISDTSSRVLRPYIDNLVVEPLRRHIAQTYRPNLLSESMAVRQYLRGAWTREQLDKELAIEGWSPERIEAFINNGQKFLGFDDAVQLSRGGGWDAAKVVDNLRQQGYAEDDAWLMYESERRKRLDAIWARVLGPALTAHANRDITTGDFRNQLIPIVEDPQERELWATIGDTLRALNIKHLSHGEVIDCIELGILPRAYYRDWLTREGYPTDEAFALELRLAAKIDAQTAVEAHRAALEAEHTGAKEATRLAALARKAEVDAQRALHRRGALGDLNRAVVRGAIPISRLEDVLAEEYDADTVGILVGLVEADRLAYVDQQTRAEEARQRAGLRHIDTGALEQAVLQDVLTLQEFRGQLRGLGFPAGDADLLTATLEARKRDLDVARAARAAADEAARHKSIDLGRAERLVRRGAGTLAQYDALLASLGFAEPARVAMTELLHLEIADDAKALALRDADAERRRTKGLSLEQMRRAVLIGAKTVDQVQTYLVAEGYTSEAQLVLLAELRRDVADTDAARATRAAHEATAAFAPLPLARVHQAARLGLLTPATYQARLVRERYTPEDIAIELELLLVEIADVQAARVKRDALTATLDAPRALSLGQVASAVRTGAAPLDTYRAAAADVYSLEDVDLLVATLSAELATLADARDRRVTIVGELTARTLSLGELEAAVKAGLVTLDAYRAQLVAWGYGSDDADLLAALLFEHLAAAGGAP